MLELTMAVVSAADEGATAGMLMADAPSEPGAVLRVGRDKTVCRLSTPDGTPAHVEMATGDNGVIMFGSPGDEYESPRARSRVPATWG